MKKNKDEFYITLCTCTPLDPCCPDIFFNPKEKMFRIKDDFGDQIKLSQQEMREVVRLILELK